MLIHRIGLAIAGAAAKIDPKSNDNRFAAVLIDDRARLAATDGHLWLRMDAQCREPDLFIADKLSDLSPMRAETVVLPSDVLQDFEGACDKSGAEQIVVCRDDVGQATLATIDGKTTRTFLVTPKEQAFPDLDRVSRHDGLPLVKITFGIDVLKKLIRTLAACSAEQVQFTIWDPVSVVNVRAIAREAEVFGNVIDGGLMPMRTPDDPDEKHPTAPLPSVGPVEPPEPRGELLETIDRQSQAAGETPDAAKKPRGGR